MSYMLILSQSRMFFSVAALPALDDIEADAAAMAMLTNFS